MQADFTVEEIVELIKKTKKTDFLFKPLKKVKTALQAVGLDAVSMQSTSRVLAFHFGLGNALDKQMIQSIKPKLSQALAIIPGNSYCILNFQDEQVSGQFLSKMSSMPHRPIFFGQIQYQNMNRLMVFMYCKSSFLKDTQLNSAPNCPSVFHQARVPGLFLFQDLITKQQEEQLLQNIDKGKWSRLNNRRVQHYGYQFKYGRNQIDKDQKYNPIPQYFDNLFKKLKKIRILEGMDFDQLTINDYFAGNGIPAHFDTHSPFQQIFLSVSMLSGVVMDFRKYDGEQQYVYLRQRSAAIFSGQVRYAWTHAIACRKIDKIDDQIKARSRRISLTFRKIKFTPCICPYYFYCDSQGYDQSTMKKNNPLLAKHLSEQHSKILEKYSTNQIQKQFVQKAYNGFGFDFHNKVIQEVKNLLRQVQKDDLVLDIGCGNGQYRNHLPNEVWYIGIEKCTVMIPVENEVHMDCLRLAFKDNSFDKIIFVAVLHHFASKNTRFKALTQAYRVIKKGGIMYLSVMSYHHKSQIYSSPETILDYCLPTNKISIQQEYAHKLQIQSHRLEQRGYVYQRYYHLFTIEELTQLLKEAQFQIIEMISTKDNLVAKVMK